MKRTIAAAAALAIAIGLLTALGAAPRTAVWIDTDPAIGEPERDVDDGLALVQAFHSPELDIRGVSVVFGNAELDRGLPIARRFAREFGPPQLKVFGGAAKASRPAVETDASRAIAEALRAQPLTILALGPATNVATVLEKHPELARRITRVVAVAGRRPGQRFTTGSSNARGHRDFNFELDPHAFQVLLDSHVELVLAPFEISSKVWLKSADLDRLAASPSAASRALAAPARAWLSLWGRLFGVDGFNPFDTLAVAYAISSDGFACETLQARIQTLADDETEPGVQGTRVERKPYLIASRSVSAAGGRVTYCSTAPDGFKDDLLARLTTVRTVDAADFASYADVLRAFARPPRVDYAALKSGRAALDAAVAAFAQPARSEEQSWPRDRRMAFWINAYNAFTLRAIVDHYPIRGSWFSFAPRNSIRQIDGVWTQLPWQAAGRAVTLDDIEHRILRPEFLEPRVHFAINCASLSCPPLAAEPYRAATLDTQLDEAARRYLASPEGLRIERGALSVSMILQWYGADFVKRFAPASPPGRPDTERAILGVVARFGPAEAAALAKTGTPRIQFLDYNWSLNDIHQP